MVPYGHGPEQKIAQLEYRLHALEKDFRDVSMGMTAKAEELARAHNAMAGNLRILARKVGIATGPRWHERLAAWFKARRAEKSVEAAQ